MIIYCEDHIGDLTYKVTYFWDYEGEWPLINSVSFLL